MHKWISKEVKIREIFFNLIQQNQGSITAIDLAIAANISGTEAKKYLKKYAVEFDATFDETAEGNLVYLFPITNKRKIKQENNLSQTYQRENYSNYFQVEQKANNSLNNTLQNLDTKIKTNFGNIEKDLHEFGQSLNNLFKF